jgi:hypothetical protein
MFLVAFLLQILLLILFWFSQALLLELNMLAAYLRVTDSSAWEKDVLQMKPSLLVGLKGPQLLLFLVLGALAWLVPFVLAAFFKPAEDILLGRVQMLLDISTVAYVVLILAVGKVLFAFGGKFDVRWAKLKEESRRDGTSNVKTA